MEIIEAAKIGAACLVAIAATGASLETANNYYGFKKSVSPRRRRLRDFRYGGHGRENRPGRSNDGLRRARLHLMIFVPVAIAAWSALVMFL